MNRGFVVLVGVVAPGRGVHSSSGARRGGRLSWRPVGLVDNPGLAEAMVRLLCERSPGVQARVVSLDGLATELGGEEAERILDRLHNSTTAETARAHELEREAAKRCPEAAERLLEVGVRGRSAGRLRPGVGVQRVEPPVLVSVRPKVAAEPAATPPRLMQRRSEVDRRSGGDRRRAAATGLAARVIRSIERRVSGERRSGVDRREQQPLSVA